MFTNCEFLNSYNNNYYCWPSKPLNHCEVHLCWFLSSCDVCQWWLPQILTTVIDVLPQHPYCEAELSLLNSSYDVCECWIPHILTTVIVVCLTGCKVTQSAQGKHSWLLIPHCAMVVPLQTQQTGLRLFCQATHAQTTVITHIHLTQRAASAASHSS